MLLESSDTSQSNGSLNKYSDDSEVIKTIKNIE